MRRAASASAALAAIALFAWASVQVHRARVAPEEIAHPGPLGRILGPAARPLDQAAEGRIESALLALEDDSRPPAERFAAYRRDLAAAERLLLRSLAANPAQARALARLAAIRFELRPPADEEGVARLLDTIAAASRMAPRVPDVQLRLGELLLRMGRDDDAVPYLARAIELDPSSARRAVGFLRERLWRAAAITEALPRAPAVVAALGEAYVQEGTGREWLALAEPAIPAGGRELLSAYGSVAIRSGEAARLEARLSGIGKLPDPSLEAERLRQISAARLETGNAAGALAAASEAAAILPDDAGLAEHAGRVALRAGRAPEAARAFRDALAVLSRTSGSPRSRARLYAAIGSAEEARGRPDLAFDAYRMAVGLDPAAEPAARRLREMGRAAGLPRVESASAEKN